MRLRWLSLIVPAVLAGIVILCLLGISHLRSRVIHERGHLLLSFLPWLHLALSYAVATYVRIGFGAWPRSCIDNPELPMLGGLVMGVVLGLLIIPIGVPVWLGWLVIRFRRSMNRFCALSTTAFVTGIAAMVVAQIFDPRGFWSWVWD
jgi:hypothetical protein